MPSWKKLVVSGSDASLNSLNVNGTVTANAFVGDGSGLTNVTGGGGGSSFPFNGDAVITGSLEVANNSLQSIIEVRNNTLFLNGLEVPNYEVLEKMVVQEPDATFTNFTTVTHNGEIVTNS